MQLELNPLSFAPRRCHAIATIFRIFHSNQKKKKRSIDQFITWNLIKPKVHKNPLQTPTEYKTSNFYKVMYTRLCQEAIVRHAPIRPYFNRSQGGTNQNARIIRYSI